MAGSIGGDRVSPVEIPTDGDMRVIDTFFGGCEVDHADTVNICVNKHGSKLLMGYNHMILAYRPHDDRYGPVAFEGWTDASSFAHSLVHDVCSVAEDTELGAPSWVDFSGDPDRSYLSGITGVEADYNRLHKHYNQHHVLGSIGEQ
jgi:hypothetical protein